MAITNYFLIGVALGTFLITLFVYRGKKDAVRQSFLLLGSGFSFWTISVALMSMTKSPLFITPIFISSFLAFGGFYLLARTFPSTTEILRWQDYLILSPMIALAIPLFLGGIMESVIFHADGTMQPVHGAAFPFFVLTALAYLVAGIDLIIKKWKKSSGRQKMQIRYLALGLSISFFIIFFADILLPALGIYQFNVLGAATPIIFVGFTAYAIVQHQFLDIRVVIQRGLVYTVLLVLIVSLYLLIIHVLTASFHQSLNVSAVTGAALTTLLGIFTVPYIDQYLRKKTDRFFFKDRYNYSEALYTLSEAINAHVRLSDTVTYAEESLKKIFKTEVVVIKLVNTPQMFLTDPNTQLQRLATLTLPITFEHKVIATLYMGEKLSGHAYTEEDLALLRTFAHQAATAFENARLFKEVADYSADLENRVSQRTEQIKELQAAQQRMLIDISHNIQTPLTIVKAQLGVMEELSENSEDLQLFEKSIDDISSFIRELLNLAQLEAIGLTQKANFDLSALVTDQLEYFEVIAESKGIALRSHVEPDSVIYGNVEMCKQLLDNLVSNAFKYTEQTTKEQLVSLVLTKTATTVTLTIADTGIGIAEGELPLIFAKFYRSDDAKKKASGTGLGLAFVETITKLHNGTVAVSSQLGQGTTFTLTFPLSEK